MPARQSIWFAILVTASCISGCESNRADSDQISFATEKIDLHNCFIGTEQKFSIDFVNTSRNAVGIKELRSDCGCTRLETESGYVSPNSQTRITGILQCGDEEGPFSRRIFLETVCGETRSAEISVNVVGYLSASPTQLTFRPDYLKSSCAPIELNVKNNTDQPISFFVTQQSSLCNVVPFTDEIAPGQSIPVTFSLADEFQFQAQEITVRLQTNNPLQRYVRIPIKIDPVQKLCVEPSAIYFGIVRKQHLLARNKIEICISGEVLSQFLDIQLESEVSFLSPIELRRIGPNEAVAVFQIIDDLSGSNLGGSVNLILHDEQGRTAALAIPISGFIEGV